MNGNATETAYNFTRARLLREEGLSAEAEQRHRFGERRGQADVLLDFDGYAVVIEAEFGDPAKEDANRRFPKQKPAIVNGLPVRLVVALGYPPGFADLPESMTRENLAVCDNLRIVYRYYREGWSEETTGRVADLAETLRNYWVQSDSGTSIGLIVQHEIVGDVPRLGSLDFLASSPSRGNAGRLLVSFSESTRIAEVLIIATKNRQQATRNHVRFVNLLHNPDEPVQAMSLTPQGL